MGTKINRCVAVKGSSPSLYWRRTLRRREGEGQKGRKTPPVREISLAGGVAFESGQKTLGTKKLRPRVSKRKGKGGLHAPPTEQAADLVLEQVHPFPPHVPKAAPRSPEAAVLPAERFPGGLPWNPEACGPHIRPGPV